MTDDKALKRAIRARMNKTGERYTAARRHVLGAAKAARPPMVADPGHSDETIKRGSGKSWDEWLRILDEWGAKGRSHGDIAAYVGEVHGVSGWWAQAVTVGYERARGMRSLHQGPEGFSANVSKTFPVDVDRLFRAFVDARRRNRWLESGTMRIRTKQPSKSARFDYGDGTTRVYVGFIAKGDSKATVQLQHARLSGPVAVEESRAFWKERLENLGKVIR